MMLAHAMEPIRKDRQRRQRAVRLASASCLVVAAPVPFCSGFAAADGGASSSFRVPPRSHGTIHSHALQPSPLAAGEMGPPAKLSRLHGRRRRGERTARRIFDTGSLFGVGFPEAAVIALLGWFLLGPEELFKLSKQAGNWLGELRTYVGQAAKQYESALDDDSTRQAIAGIRETQKTVSERQARGETATVPVVLLAGAVRALVGACREKRQGVEKGRGCKVASRAFESELGVQAPVGFWDPLRFAISGDVEEFKRRRATEIKHGRVSMIACIGYIVPEFFKWPGMLSPSQGVYFSDIPNGIQALSKIPGVGIFQWFLFCGFIETGAFKQEDERPAGDFKRGGVLGVPNGSSLPKGETRDRKLNAEIANGRLAMMAIIANLPFAISAFNFLSLVSPLGKEDPLGTPKTPPLLKSPAGRSSSCLKAPVSMNPQKRNH